MYEYWVNYKTRVVLFVDASQIIQSQNIFTRLGFDLGQTHCILRSKSLARNSFAKLAKLE